ncbi:MAG: translation initiation factor IF-2 [Bacilli bacterium]|nr:translation initiation factor IF-2 [Bacilli bacterium]
MKVKQIIEILNEKHIACDNLLDLLDNVGVEADLETEIEADILKKLGKFYKTEIKVSKPKKETEPAPEPVVAPEVKEEPKVEVKPEPKKEVKEEPKKEEKVEAKPEVKKEAKEEPKKEEAKPAPKKEEPKAKEAEVELSRVYDDTYEEYEAPKKEYTRLKNVKKNKAKGVKNRQANVPIKKEKDAKILYFSEGMTVGKVASVLGLGQGQIVSQLVSLGIMASLSEVIDRETVELLAVEAGFEVKDEIETDITKFEQMDFEDSEDLLEERPAIVTIMGHVDHGKTSLLDKIRKSHVALGEAGGITQAIGAYQVTHNGKLITFIDTPGHAAFTEMRARGAQVTDIVVLVVAADDGVMPQTIEAIQHAKAANVPIIVAINKMDKTGANPDRVKQELAAHDLLAEDWGGKTIFVPISAKVGTGIDDLLEMILLVAEMNEYKANPNRLGSGYVLESRLEKGRGVVASILVRNGSVKVGDPIVAGNTYGKIRAMQDENRVNLKVALPSKAVEITGLVDIPSAGDHFMVFEDERTTRLVAEQRAMRAAQAAKAGVKAVSLATMFDDLEGGTKELNLIVKADVQGSIEAITGSLEKLNIEGTKVNVIGTGVGSVTDNDIALAIPSKAVIIGFNVRPTSQISDNAKQKGIEIRLYNVIYKLIEDIEAALKGLLDPVYEEKVVGEAEVRSTFHASKVGTIAGCYVNNGVITRGANCRLVRDGIVVFTSTIASLKHYQDDIKEANKGYECGLTIENYNDIKVGDIVETYILEKVQL